MEGRGKSEVGEGEKAGGSGGWGGGGAGILLVSCWTEPGQSLPHEGLAVHSSTAEDNNGGFPTRMEYLHYKIMLEIHHSGREPSIKFLLLTTSFAYCRCTASQCLPTTPPSRPLSLPPFSPSLPPSLLLPSLSPSLSHSHRLVGLVVKFSASEAEGPGLESHLRRDFSESSHTSDFKIGTPVTTLPFAWHYRVSAGTGRPGVSIL